VREPPWKGLWPIWRVTNKGEIGFGKASDRVRRRTTAQKGILGGSVVGCPLKGRGKAWPGELSPARSRSKLGRGIVHATGGLSRGRVEVLGAPPAYDFRSAPATPDGVCACLFRSFL